MAKGSSSASSATRKKHARKAAGPVQPEEPLEKQKKVKTKEKGKKKEPRQKIYIPPIKPPPVQPDPLDTTGIAHQLPPDLLVVLRKLGKKNTLTKISALEELKSGWVDKCKKKGEDDSLVSTLEMMLPVWLHHLPALFMNPSRRIRYLTVSLHVSLLHVPDLRDQIFFFLNNTSSTYQSESILGTWCMVAHDVDRQVSSSAIKSWNNAVSVVNGEHLGKLVLDESLIINLVSFVQRSILDPGGVYSYLNPIQPVVAPTPPRKASGRSTPMTPKRGDTEQAFRSKAEEEDEDEQDRKARLRVCAFGALGWILDTRVKKTSASLEDLMGILDNPAVWTSLHFAETSLITGIESFGYNQPLVRMSAWSILEILLKNWRGFIEPLVPALSSAILRSAWVEPDSMVRGSMWQPLLNFLKDFPTAWDVEIASEYNKHDEEDLDPDEDENLDSKTGNPPIMPSAEFRKKSLAYKEFLQFLELGCSGSPRDGYPVVVIVLSTIPSQILASSQSSSPLADFFSSFWAAVDGRALKELERTITSEAFLSSLFECLILLIRRIRKGTGLNSELLLSSQLDENDQFDQDKELRGLLGEQIRRAWEAMVSRQLRVEESAAGKLVAQTLVSLNEIHEDLFRTAWDTLSVLITDQTCTTRSESETLTLAPTFLKVFLTVFQEGTKPKSATCALIRDISHSSLLQCEAVLTGEVADESATASGVNPLVNILNTFGGTFFDNIESSARLDKILISNAYRLLSVAPSLLLAYLAHCQDEGRTLELWHVLLSELSQPEIPRGAILPLLDAAQQGRLPKYLKPNANELDAMVKKLLSDAFNSAESTQMQLLFQLLQSAPHFLSDTSFKSILQSLNSFFSSHVDRALHDHTVPQSSFEAPLDLLKTVVEHWPQLSFSSEATMSPMSDIFVFAYLLPMCWDSDDDRSFSVARDLWTQWLANGSTEHHAVVLQAIQVKLKGLIADTQARPSPEDVIQMISDGCPGFAVNVIQNVFSSRVEMDLTLDNLPSDPISPSLAVLEPLIPPASMFESKTTPTQTYDDRGYSSYARVVSGLLYVFLQDRQAAKDNMWGLRHVLSLALYASDFLSVPSAPSPVFHQAALGTDLSALVSKVQQVTTYLSNSSPEDGWRSEVISALLEDRKGDLSENISNFLINLIRHASKVDNPRESRILRHVLQHVLDKAELDEADRWILLARKFEKTAPQTAMAIVASVTEFAPAPPRLDRYRNELAANVLGIPAAKADTEGLLLLQKLAATAPDPGSAVVFLPQQRAVNVVKTCQQWIASDEDMVEEVESIITLIFFHLAPILQNVSGSHLDLMFDVIESNLENSSFNDDTTLVTLARTLRLVGVIEDLASTNKSLRQDWQARRTAIFTLVKSHVTVRIEDSGASVPRSTCRELALTIIQGLPASLLNENTLPEMCHLLTDSSSTVQQMAYRLLQDAAYKRTEYLVVEAGVDTEGLVKAELPIELLDILQRSLDEGDEFETDGQDLFGCLLSWMVIFDCFANASLKVRSGYVDQMRNLDMIAVHFIPTIFGILKLYDGLPKAMKLDIWAVDEYHVQFCEPRSLLSIELLAAHLYYRSLSTVPSLLRSWLLDCNDRQLCTSVITYTSQHFSQVLIQAELTHVKSPGSLTELADEHMTIKVANSVNEVTASYLVDEHQLEMTLKMPSDWPLHAIEIKDSKKIGVAENRWRAWVLGVQQTISAHNGRIVDGLSLFKKNVTLHFEGQVECPICYSIISVTDGSLPKKPCKTCKNRFHSGCLYKWFNTSHSSRCPLCRSDII